MARVRLLQPEDLAGEDRVLVDALAASGGLINLYRAMAHSPVAMRRLIEFMSCLWSGSLDARLIEIAILSVVSASDAPYPLGWHIGDGIAAGLTADEVRAIIAVSDPEGLSQHDAAVARFARELTTDARVSDATYDAVAGFMSEQQIVELTMLVGAYRLIACVANGLRVDLDDVPARALEEFGLTTE